ncbi:MAG: bifunctional adenosylcobinamide kinase/adenosylcobinamide-phosphate guanylyltransferase [Anaerotignaceae bacterium]
MIIFVTGGAYQGKTEFAKTLGQPVLNGLHLVIEGWLKEGKDINIELEKILTGDITIVCNELGCGIVPLDKFQRELREVVGRAACNVAKKADIVYRVQAGIPEEIKTLGCCPKFH